jgi:hypothetical protein
MKLLIPFIYTCCLSSLFSTMLLAQDTIVKLNGQVIPAKIIEVGTNAIRYTKSDIKEGPTFVDYKTDIAYVKYSNGQKEVYSKQPQVATIQKPLLDTAAIKKGQAGQNILSTKNRIEFMNNKYTVNGQRVKRKDVDRLLSKSKNPAIQITYKTAKTTRILQKVVGLTSIGSTTTGGVMTVSTLFTCFKESQDGGSVSAGSYVNAGLSFLGTLTLPITSKILKNRRDKLYDKTIDLYNETN